MQDSNTSLKVPEATDSVTGKDTMPMTHLIPPVVSRLRQAVIGYMAKAATLRRQVESKVVDRIYGTGEQCYRDKFIEPSESGSEIVAGMPGDGTLCMVRRATSMDDRYGDAILRRRQRIETVAAIMPRRSAPVLHRAAASTAAVNSTACSAIAKRLSR